MPKGRKLKGAKRTRSHNQTPNSSLNDNYDSETSTISRSETERTVKVESSDENQDQQHQRTTDQNLPMNEAIAFTSMIDSNINGRLQDLFHDTRYHFTTYANPHNVGSYNDDSGPSTSGDGAVNKGFQSDQLFGDIRPQMNSQQRNATSQPFLPFHQRKRHGVPFYQGLMSSDIDSSPELPKLSSFELNNNERGSAHSTPASFQYNYNPTNIYSPKLRHEFDPNYSVSPSLSESSFQSTTPGGGPSNSYFQAPIPFNPERSINHDPQQLQQLQVHHPYHHSSTSSNSNTTASSKPSYSASSNSSVAPPPFLSIEDRSNSNNSMKSDSSDLSDSKIVKKKKKLVNLRGGTCTICNKVIKRDMSRHMRIHEEVSRFRCVYPRGHCLHKTGFFNRQYDFKKHLLHFHFEYDDGDVKKFYSLNEKLPHWGTCNCGQRFTGGDWLEKHILIEDTNKLCSHLKKLRAESGDSGGLSIRDGVVDGVKEEEEEEEEEEEDQ